jgi:hypothetical protein
MIKTFESYSDDNGLSQGTYIRFDNDYFLGIQSVTFANESGISDTHVEIVIMDREDGHVTGGVLFAADLRDANGKSAFDAQAGDDFVTVPNEYIIDIINLVNELQ